MNTKIITIILALLIGGGAGTYYVYNTAQKDNAEKEKTEALQKFLKQGDGTIRKPGTSGFKSF
jgi:hypothetical protein